MKKKIEKILTHPILCNYPNLWEAESDVKSVTEELLSLFLKEYEKRKPKKIKVTTDEMTTIEDGIDKGFNCAIDEFDERIYKMLKTK